MKSSHWICFVPLIFIHHCWTMHQSLETMTTIACHWHHQAPEWLLTLQLTHAHHLAFHVSYKQGCVGPHVHTHMSDHNYMLSHTRPTYSMKILSIFNQLLSYDHFNSYINMLFKTYRQLIYQNKFIVLAKPLQISMLMNNLLLASPCLYCLLYIL